MCNKHLLKECINQEDIHINKISINAGIDALLVKRTISKSLTIIIDKIEDVYVAKPNGSWIDRIVNKYLVREGIE